MIFNVATSIRRDEPTYILGERCIVSIVVQSFKVQKVMVAMMISVLQMMKWYLKTAFGQSATAFDGTPDDPSMGSDRGMVLPRRGFLPLLPFLSR